MDNNNNLENNGYDNTGYNNTGYNDQTYADNSYDNAGYSDQAYTDNSYNNAGYSDQTYADNGYDNAGYNDQAYTDSGYNNAGYNDQTYAGSGYENAGYDNSIQTVGYDNSGIDIPSANGLDIPQHGASSGITNVDSNFAESTESTLNSLNAELTDAEKEDIRREKAAKRRKQMLREKRRRERQQQMIIRWSIFIAGIILVLFIIVKIFTGIGSLIKSAKHKKTTEEVTTEATTTEEPVAQIDENILAKAIPDTRDKAMELLNAQAETNPDIKNICENQAVYPDIVLEYLAVNSELLEFALHYPAQITVPFDGDFNIEDINTADVPLYLAYDSRWAYADYGKTVLGLNGNAPTCLSMACVYLTRDGSKNPIIIGDYSMEQGYLDENGHTDYKLMTEGAKEFGLEATELSLDKESLINALQNGEVVICAVNSGDFTKDKSFIVIKGYTNGFFYINDPSSEARSSVGWDFKRLSSQIDKMWSMKKNESVSSDDSTDTDSTDGSSNDGTSTDGTSTDGTSTDDTSSDGTSSDGTSNDGTSTDGSSADSSSNDGSSTDN